MYIRHHFLAGLVFSLLVYPKIGWGALLILAASVLPDIDHYLLYIYLKKDLHPKRAHKFCADIKDASKLFLPLHFVESLVVLLFAALYFSWAWLLLVGLLLHILLDIIAEKWIKPTKREFSLLGWIAKRAK